MEKKNFRTPNESNQRDDVYMEVCNNISQSQDVNNLQSQSYNNRDQNNGSSLISQSFESNDNQLDEDQRMKKFFQSLKNINFNERSFKINQFFAQNQFEFLNETQFKTFKRTCIRNLGKGAEYLNEKFSIKFENILNEGFRKNFSYQDIKEILMGCILYSEILQELPNDQKILMKAPKILKDQYFEQSIDSFDDLIEIAQNDEQKETIEDIMNIFNDIKKQKSKDERNFQRYLVESRPWKDIKILYDDFEGDLKPVLFDLIRKSARDLNADMILDHLQQNKQYQKEEKKQSNNPNISNEGLIKKTRTPISQIQTQNTPKNPPLFKQTQFEMLIDYQNDDEDNLVSLNIVKENFKKINKILQNEPIPNDQLQEQKYLIKSFSNDIQDSFNFYIDDEQESFNKLLKNCIQELKITEYFKVLFPGETMQQQIQPIIEIKNVQTPQIQKQTPEEPSHNQSQWYIDEMFQLLMFKTEDSLNQFNQYVQFEDFQKNKNFKNEFNHLMQKQNDFDYIQRRIKDKYQIIFEKYDQNKVFSQKEKEIIVVGCAIFQQIKDQIGNGDQLKQPVFIGKFSQKNSLLNLKKLKVSNENRNNFNSMVELLEDLIYLQNENVDQFSGDFQDIVLYIKGYLNDIKDSDKMPIVKLFKQVIAENDLNEHFTLEDQVEPEPQPVPVNPKLVEKNLSDLLQDLIDNRSKEVPQDLEKRIEQKYFQNLDVIKKSKVNNLFIYLKEADKMNLRDENENTSAIRRVIQECFEYFLAQGDQSELLNILFQYQILKVPSLNIEKPLAREEKIKQDFKEVNEMLPLIGNKYSIKDFMKIYSQTQIDEDKKEMVLQFKNDSTIDGSKLLILLFDCIKNRNNFNFIISIFSEIKSDFKITKTLLFIYIYLHADQQLRTMLFTSCSQYMPIPMTAFSPWDIEKDTQMPKRIFFPEMVYAFEKHQSILQIKIRENLQNQNIRSCSSIINKLFGKDFQTHLDSNINEGTIEIQFDYNCTKVFYLAVADAHGYLEDDIMKKVAVLFDCLIIHTDQVLSKNQKLDNMITYLKEQNSSQKILIIVHQNNQIKQFRFEPIQRGMNKQELQIPLFESLQENNKTNFYNCCYSVLEEYFVNQTNQYIQNPKQRNQSRLQLLDFLKLYRNEEVVQIKQQIGIVDELVEKIIFQDDLKSPKFLPMIHLAKLKSEFENILLKESELTDKEREDYRIKKQDNDVIMSQQKCSQIVQVFQEIIDRDIQLEILPILTQIVKGYLQTIRDPHEKQLNELRTTLGQKNDQQQKIIKQQLLDIKKEIDKKTFSQEMIIREIYYLSQFSSQKRQYDQVMRQISTQLIRNGQPLELIDGDTLQFISNIYENIYQENDKEEVLVVSVIGVQSAGKSLLLNFLFGTQFHSSAGRCTKGVYSSILTYQCHKSGRNKKILLLDTEGIQSPDARDPKFDRKIVFYILSISHVILLCNKQEMNKDMGEIFKLVAYELVNAKQQNIQSPDIYIILNMLAQLDSKIQNECVNKLQDEFIEINENKEKESVNEILKITIHNVIPLPFAFQTINFGPNQNNDESKINTVNIPQLEFTNLIQQLRKRILNKFDDIENVKTQKMTLHEWFKFAEHIWDYTNQLRTLESFSNLQQKKQDKELTDIINSVVTKFYEDSWNFTLKKFVDDHLIETLDSLAGGGAILFNNVLRQIQIRLDNKYDDIARQALADYQKECKEKNIQQQLAESKQRILEKKREHYIKKVNNYCANKVQSFIQEKSKNVGDSTLQQIIVKLLRVKNSYTLKEAIDKFEYEAWPEVISKSQDVLSTKNEIIKRIQSQVSNEFHQVIKMRNEEKESFCNQKYLNNSDLFQLFTLVMQKFENLQLILFEGDRKPVNYKKVSEFQKQEKQYLNKFPKQIYEETQVFEYYRWKKALQEIVNISKLSHEIRIAVLDEYDNQLLQWADKQWKQVKNGFSIIFGNGGKKDLTYEKIQRNYKCRDRVFEIIKKFKRELLKIGIEYIADDSQFIPSEQFENYQRSLHVINTQQIIYLNIERMLNSKQYFKPYSLPIENPNECSYHAGYNSKPNYEYLIFKDQYCIDDYIQTFNMEIQQEDLFYNKQNRTVKISSEMNSIIETRYKSSIDQFLKFLSGAKKLKNIDHLAQKQTTQYFQQHLNWQLIIKQIEECIVKNNSRNKDQNEKLSYYIEILKKNDNQSVNILQKFHLFESKCTKAVITDVKKLIDEINEELDCFCLSISEEGISLIYLLTQTALSGLCYNLDLIEHNQPIRMLDERKETEKKLFVGRLTMNNEMVDQGLGFKLINEYSKLCYEDCKNFIVVQFKEEIDNISDEFQNLNQMKQLEEFCIDVHQKKIDYKTYVPNQEEQKEIDDYIQLIVDPKKILEKKFEKKFHSVSRDLIQKSIQNFKNRFIDILENFQSYLLQFQVQIHSKKIEKLHAGVLFQLHDSSPLKLNDINDLDLQRYQKEALMKYFLEMISLKWNSNIIFKLQNERIWLQKNPNYNLPIFTDLKVQFDDQNQNFIKSILKDDDQISNLNVFIEEAIKTIKKVKNSLELNINDGQIHENNPQDNDPNKFLLNKQELLGKCYQKLRQKYIGCKEHCPLCRKQCDVAHNEHEEFKDERHECQNGHQMQGFGGSKYFKDNFAILRSCDEIKNQDNIKFNGDDIIWENFKLNKFPNWSFESSNEAEVQKNREKNVKIWNLIGKDLCDIYNSHPQNIGIIFKEATVEPEIIVNIQKIHYVIMLDDSGSMRGKPWQNLMNAFTIFLNKLLEDKILQQNSWISVINHNETSVIYFEEKQPNLSLVSKIIFRGNSNDFDNPLFDAHRICKKNPQKYDKFLLYFMSDGEWKFPQSGINRLVQDSTIINKIEFHSIAFGSRANKDILQRMANSFPKGQGIMSDAPNAQALAQTFIDIVPNIYA